MSKVRNCICCNTQYKYCPTCGEYAKYPKWMSQFDKDVCHEMFNVISGYNMGIMTKDDVKKVVDEFNVTDFSIFKDSIANKLNELFTNTNKKEDVVETPVEEIVEDVETEKITNKRNTKRKNKNMDIDLIENE